MEDTSIEFGYQIIPDEQFEEPKNGFPEMETMIRNMKVEKTCKVTVMHTTKTDPALSSFMSCQDIDPKQVPINRMGPREQEEADEWIRKGVKCLFDNQFMKAKSIFQSKINNDPLYSNNLGIMAFMKAMMTHNEDDIYLALGIFTASNVVSSCQINSKGLKKTYRLTHYLSALVNSNSTGLPLNPSYKRQANIDPEFISSGDLRAYVIRAECCLLSGILQMLREDILGLVKCSTNLQKAYSDYSIVWQEYKRMGQQYTKYMDRDTVSAMQFGLGTLHLIVTCFPPKFAQVFSLLGFKSNPQLGFALLKLCIEAKSIKSSFASLILLFYYSMACHLVPQLYRDLLLPALDCLNACQKQHPNALFFLYCAGHLARLSQQHTLSTRSFLRSSELCQEPWIAPIRQPISLELAFNKAQELDWQACLDQLYQLPESVFQHYFISCCQSITQDTTQQILTLASALNQCPVTSWDLYAAEQIRFFESRGYQHMEFFLPLFELLMISNGFESMTTLETGLEQVQGTLELIYEREKVEYSIRTSHVAPDLELPDYYQPRIRLLLVKCAMLNALERHRESIAHVNWMMDHLDHVKGSWLVPFIYWEAGVTSWGLGDYTKSRKVWELAMAHKKSLFEYQLTVKLSLALRRCEDMGVLVEQKPKKNGLTTNGKRRMPVVQ
ncbi:unnamed protein product [Rhizopus stolonifer]